MNRRQFITIAATGIGTISIFGLKPKDRGAPYTSYFKKLNDELKKNGPQRPCLIVDLDKVNKNIDTLKGDINNDDTYRVVAKSLPSPGLLKHVMKRANTKKLMIFHQPFINAIAEEMPDADILLGKPMTAGSARIFYEKLSRRSAFNPATQLQWLIDTKERLDQYHSLAKSLNTRLRINIEIDVGLHRGGLQKPEELIPLLDQIIADPAHLEFAGFMGYEPHVVALPGIVKSRTKAFTESMAAYTGFVSLVKDKYRQIKISDLCLNGAGSPTLTLHRDGTILNDVSAGSCLVKPTDFDVPTLDKYIPAAYIATPVLKKFSGTAIPAIEWTKKLMGLWNPNKKQTFFIYGGRWMAEYESPGGLEKNGLYGFSSNQEMVNGSEEIRLNVEDNIFLRPTQSEAVFLQFGDIIAIEKGTIIDSWKILKQG
jgi:D-serine deaminase-like pyridoxal phosphate-dependent protein